ncbi:hypothetical protein [Plasmodium yoelii yoelii]|uniref:Uncharacterized protein n=1 Tax=Plasmodium yoelii yoelii TaxID=73239 RepID=Q7RBA9_PLAYO|nr:hypothetical protein [Plasmodium yoelii yoelii]
MIQIISFAK